MGNLGSLGAMRKVPARDMLYYVFSRLDICKVVLITLSKTEWDASLKIIHRCEGTYPSNGKW